MGQVRKLTPRPTPPAGQLRPEAQPLARVLGPISPWQDPWFIPLLVSGASLILSRLGVGQVNSLTLPWRLAGPWLGRDYVLPKAFLIPSCLSM